MNTLLRTHLFGDALSLLGGILELGDDCVELIRLVLDRLHLFPGENNFMISKEIFRLEFA